MKTRTIAASAALLLSAASCNFLSVENVGKSDIEGFFSEVEALEAASYGVYHIAYGIFDSYALIYPEVASDELVLSVQNAADWVPYQNFTNTSDDETFALGMIWKNAYSAIGNLNEILFYAPALRNMFPQKADRVDNVLGQAYFFRALMHLELCLCYAQNYSYTTDASHPGIPVVDHILGLTEEISRDKVSDVYASIVRDLKAALDAFPSEGDYSSPYFASPLACKALLARVYLYMGRWSDASKWSSEVIAEKALTPRENYLSMFTTRTPSSDESIFRFNGSSLGKSSYKMYWYQEPKARPSERVKSELSNPDDIRSGILKHDTYSDVVMKYSCLDGVSSEEDRYYNPIILRVSEMYLIRAEAECELGNLEKAAADIRALESRALGISVQQVPLTYSDAVSLSEIIEKERLRELCFEGHRLYDITRRHRDLVRTGDSSASVNRVKYPDYRFVLPIPAVELEANSAMENNPGFN